VVLSRAGASTLGEYPLFGLPAILVPYPFAWRYQKVNADYLVQRNAAVLIEDAQLQEQLIPVVKNLLKETSLLASMHLAVKALAQPRAATSIGNLLVEMAQRGAR
jgi:UDP-N-acetylglucosamine:LPS N-acetylglucosamine transferase